MSGGHWQYAGRRIESDMLDISRDEEARKHWPRTLDIYRRLATVIGDTEHKMDWALSGDTSIEKLKDDDMANAIIMAVAGVESQEGNEDG